MSSDNVRTGFTSNWLRTTVDVMQPKEIGFVHPPRRWQAECFEIIAPSIPVAIINAPTGSGKSTMLSMLAYQRTVSDKNKKTIIAVPQTVIGKGFNTKVFKLPNQDVIDWSVGIDLCTNAKDTVEQFSSFIKEDIFYSESYPFERILVCTHATLVAAFQSLSQEDKQTYWNNLLICVDETHHLKMHEIADEVYNMNSLGQVVDYSFRNNNEIILVSATMFRGDQKGLVSDELLKDAIKYNLPFDKYMEEMKYLKSFSYDFIIDTNEYTTDISKCINNLFLDNLKKLFIYIPHPQSYMSSGNKIQEIQDILEQLKTNLNGDKISLDENTGIYHITNILGLDYKVCDLVDETLSKRSIKFVNNEIINKDRNALDCVIALNRAKEGFDWEHANGMIVVGQRSSLTDVIQMVGRLLRDKQGKEKVKALHMLPFSPNQPTAPNLDNSLNDFFKAIAISLLMEDVFAPTSLQTNDDSAPTGQLSGATPSVSSNIFDDLELDENQRLDLFDKAQKALVNVAGGLVESQGTYSPEELKEQMPFIMKKWVEENKIEADEQQIEELAKKIYNQFAKRSLQMQGINVSNINWQMIESADPIEFTLRYVGKDTTLESLKELRRLISAGESESNRKNHIICQRIVNDVYPTQDFIDEEGLNHYGWIHGKKQAKQGKGELAWYNSDQLIAESYGLPLLFELIDTKEYFINQTEKLISYHKLHGKYPTALIDKELSSFHSRQRSKDKKCKYFQECLDYAISQGYFDIFDPIDAIKQMIDKIEKLFSYVNKNGEPTSKDKDKTNFYLIGTLRSCRQGKSENVWYSEFDVLFEENNMWHLIETAKEFSLRQTIKLKNLCLDKKRAPLSSIENEKELCAFAQRKVSGKTKWYPEEIDLLEKNSVFKYFLSNTQKRINTWILNIEELSKYIEENDGKFPSKKTHSKELATLQECKRRFANNDLEQIILDKFDELEMASHLKFVDKEFESKQKFIKLCDRLQKGTRPSAKSEIEGDFSLSSYMSTLLKGLRGQRGFINYSFYSEIAKEKNVQHFFEGLI
jgi:superfamily II DNA or RNA helicase